MTVNIPFDMQRTGAMISRLRKEHGMTQMQLADALGIDQARRAELEADASQGRRQLAAAGAM